jgi:dihydrofolate reductase|nr:MAG TPA: DHFR protein [Caudoviricetes sp.]
MVKFIWAQDKRGTIGNNGKLPWSNKTELNYFKNQTTGGVVVMGLSTWKSIGNKPFKNRLNIILTTKDEIEGYDDENVYIANSVEEVLQFEKETDRDVWIIGGAITFKAFEPFCEEAIVSTIDGDYTGDTYYTDLKDRLTENKVVVTMEGEGFTVKHYRLV